CAIVAFIIDKRLIPAAAFAGVAAVLSFVGLIHAPKVGWNANGPVALGYLAMGVVLLLFALTRPEPRVPDAEELALDAVDAGRRRRHHGVRGRHQPGAGSPVAAVGAHRERLADRDRPREPAGPARGADRMLHDDLVILLDGVAPLGSAAAAPAVLVSVVLRPQ